MKILFVSRWYPYPVDNGSKIRIYNLIRGLSACHDVDLISFASERISEDRIAAMQHYCRKVQVTEYHPERSGPLNSLIGYLSPTPRSAVASYNPDMQAFINQAERTERYDLVISSQLDMAAYTHSWQASPKIFEELELTTLYESYSMEKNPVKRMRSRLMWLKYEHYVPRLMKSFEGCTVVSALERQRVRGVAPGYGPVAVIPNGVDTAFLSGDFGELEPDSLVYSGALSFFANFGAIKYFLEAIFPLIKKRRPGAKLYITGSTRGVAIEQLPKVEGVIFTGYLDDIRPRIAKSMVNIVPLQVGGGTRLKILESLALQTPVVSTSKGVEGLDLTAGEDLLVADEPERFSEYVVELLENRTKRQQIGHNGCTKVNSRYDWQIIGSQFNDFIELMGKGH